MEVDKALEFETESSPVEDFLLCIWDDLLKYLDQVVVEASGHGTPVNPRVSARFAARVINIISAMGIDAAIARKTLQSVEFQPLSRYDIMSILDLIRNNRNYSKYILALVEKGFMDFTLPERTSLHQKYKITPRGISLLRILEAYFTGKT